MGKEKKPGSSKRFRFSVPTADVSVLQWMDAQDYPSVSLRTLIKNYIQEHGITDATCMPVEQKRPVGRPRKVPEYYEADEPKTEKEPTEELSRLNSGQSEPKEHGSIGFPNATVPMSPQPPVKTPKFNIPITDGEEGPNMYTTGDNDNMAGNDEMPDMMALMSGMRR